MITTCFGFLGLRLKIPVLQVSEREPRIPGRQWIALRQRWGWSDAARSSRQSALPERLQHRRTTTRFPSEALPAFDQGRQVASFAWLNDGAMGLFLDAAEDNLLPPSGRLK